MGGASDGGGFLGWGSGDRLNGSAEGGFCGGGDGGLEVGGGKGGFGGLGGRLMVSVEIDFDDDVVVEFGVEDEDGDAFFTSVWGCGDRLKEPAGVDNGGIDFFGSTLVGLGVVVEELDGNRGLVSRALFAVESDGRK